MYFLKRDLPDLNCGIISGHLEKLKEVFENSGMPQSVLIVDSELYYLPWEARSINFLHEFL